VVLSTPTGSGKSLVALGLHFKAMSEGKVSVYTAPIKALVSEKFFALCEDFGAPYVGMMTGDATINRDAPILCCTAEILANLALRGRVDLETSAADAASSADLADRVDAVVMDEFHYYGDKERGMAWQIPLLALPRTQLLLMSATLGDMTGISAALQQRSGRPVVQVASGERPVPLDFEYRETPLHETLEHLVNTGRAPVYIVHFTQREAAEQAQNLMSASFSSKEAKERLAEELKAVRFDSPYGKDVQRFLRHGVGLHHAGLLPKYRLLVEKLAQQGLLKVICGTDTLGVGVNIPIRTVLFTKLAKFDGEGTRILSARDFKQIAGRAGRKGFDDRGSVVAQAPEHVIENKRAEARMSSVGGHTKKAKAKKAQPEPGAVSWDKNTFERLIEKPPEALPSRFQVTHGMMMALLQGERGYRRLVELIHLSHESDDKKRRHRERARVLFRALLDAGLVSVKDKKIEVAEALQTDFSLNQALSLYLVETLSALDPADDAYALQVCTVVESVLENPKQILLRQQDKARDARYAELKAEGVEYDELKEKLDEVTWPKPLEEFIYTTFNAFRRKHPWVGENIEPKSIARDLLERYATFPEYVKEYGLERSEGLLLRYLSDFYRTLVQNVPEARKDDRVLDVQAYFRALLARVDSSLVEAWEAMANPAIRPDKPLPDVRPPLPLDHDKRAFTARVRAEMHRLVQALARGDFDEVVALVRAVDPVGQPWDAKRVAAELQPFLADKGKVLWSPLARQPPLTLLDQDVDDPGPGRWRVRQVLIDEAGDNEWFIEGRIDLQARLPEEPLVALVRIGS
jgi:superfamily II RNA helicase